jgi:bleomycin hydrolase
MGAAASTPSPPPYGTNDEKLFSDLASALRRIDVAVPVAADGSIATESLQSWEDELSSNSKAQLARTILSHEDISTTLVNRSTMIKDAHIFNHDLNFKTGPITSQKSSGRCWLFATTNVMRYNVMKKLHLDDFQLSQVCYF